MTAQKQNKRALSSYGRLGILLSAIGVILAVDATAHLSILYKLWPLLCTILGTGFFGIYQQRSRRESSYVIVGTYITGFSILALYCNFTSWSNLSTLWPVFIALMGIAVIAGYLFGNRHPGVLLSGLLSFSIAVVFYLVFSFNHQLWWSVFILVGGSFVISDRARNSR